MCHSMISSSAVASTSRIFDVVGGSHVGGQGVDEPERGIEGVVFGLIAGVGPAVGHHALVDVLRVVEQDCLGDGGAAGFQAETGQRDERVAAPVAEPGVAGDDRVGLWSKAGKRRPTMYEGLVRG